MTKYRLFTDGDIVYLQFHDDNSALWRFVPRLTPAYVTGLYMRVDQSPTQTQGADLSHLMQQPNDVDADRLKTFAREYPNIDAHFEKINTMRLQYLDFTIN